ncbi:hypothetical protein [Halalkalibacterium ligniniphilum]|uniref:hypothetical protein n=1 Tax=Halalkalibacterium ligniniphilum TaxID=1134413 RepID=UPI0003474D7D|nr:hypothetical protein [Halalkalibacterium ligniniphilum]
MKADNEAKLDQPAVVQELGIKFHSFLIDHANGDTIIVLIIVSPFFIYVLENPAMLGVPESFKRGNKKPHFMVG